MFDKSWLQNFHTSDLIHILHVFAAPATITVDWSIPPSIGALPPKRSVTGDTLKVCKGDTVVFGWGGFHGVATTSAGKYKTCSLSGYKEVAKVSGGGSYTVKPSGTKYYICQVAGHCSSGREEVETFLNIVGCWQCVMGELYILQSKFKMLFLYPLTPY